MQVHEGTPNNSRKRTRRLIPQDFIIHEARDGKRTGLAMPLNLTHMFRVPWKSILLPLSALGGFFLLYRFRYSLRYDPKYKAPETKQRDTNDQDTAQPPVNPDKAANFPLTCEQIDDKVHNFITSISEDAICRLASRHNGGQPCRVVGRDKGSFNICFFIRFENGIKWTIRVPIEPVVEDAWNKVQSEVATMRYE